MATLLLSVLPILSVLAVFVYALGVGLRMYRASGQASVLGVAATIAGLTAGRLLDRFIPLPRGLDDWVNYRDGAADQLSDRGERFLVVLSVEVALLFLLAAAISFLAITLIRRDAGPRRPVDRRRELPLLGLLALLAVGITARSKLAVLLAFLMAKAHLL